MKIKFQWDLIITNGATDEITYHFPLATVEEFLGNVWKRNFAESMKKCSNMPNKLPFPKKKYLWFKCVFTHLTIDFIETTATDPQRFQKMQINISKKRAPGTTIYMPVTSIYLYLWGNFVGKPSPLGVYDFLTAFRVGDMFGPTNATYVNNE